MSHSGARFYFADNTILFGEYNGTSGVMLTNMFSTLEEVDTHWRKQVWKTCICTTEPEPCIAYAEYGRGFYWPATACRKCGVFIGPKMPFEEEGLHRDGEPGPEEIADIQRREEKP